jgi:ureidoglycolate lyase
MKSIVALPLEPQAFRPFGDAFEAPRDYGRVYVSDALGSGRATARPSLSVLRVKPLAAATLIATKMERHEFSSQSFIPLDVGRYLVIVAPMSSSGGPDESQLKAFVAHGGQGITYGMNVWHHPLSVLDRDAAFAVTMWLDGSATDEQFVDLSAPVSVRF